MCSLCVSRPTTLAPAVVANRASSSTDSSVDQLSKELSAATATRNALSDKALVGMVVFEIALSYYVKLSLGFEPVLAIMPASQARQPLNQGGIRNGQR